MPLEPASHRALISSKVIDTFGVVVFQRGGLREQVEVLRTLESLWRYAQSHPRLRIVLDLSGMDYISCAGLSMLVRILKTVRAAGGALRLCGLQPFVAEVFRAVRLDRAFSIHENAEEAAQAPEAQLETESAF